MSKDSAAALGVSLCICIAVLAYLFHDSLGLTFGTAVKMAAFMVVLGLVAGAIFYFDDSLWGPSNLWPILAALFVGCWFPALDEWSATWGTSIPSILAYSDAGFILEPQWWATGWAKMLWLAIPLVGGYGWKIKDATR